MEEVSGMDYKRKHEYNEKNNKEIEIKDIHGIEIENFRLFKNQKVDLGKHITILSGRNGSMKSTLMGLISHIYRSDYRDVFGEQMQTVLKEVFKLSNINDTDTYKYHVYFEDMNQNLIKEPVNIDYRTQSKRHRIVPSGHGSGDGFFNLPSVYINLKRLYPLVDLGGPKSEGKVIYSEDEKEFISNFYEKILLVNSYKENDSYTVGSGSVKKKPIGPKNTFYDVESISSGEDNIGQIVSKLISFMRISNENKNDNIVGILGIDEFEASLHPIAQLNLFNYLLKWSKKYNVKIIISTHSLYLLKEIILQENEITRGNIVVNFISSEYKSENEYFIRKNPSYEDAMSELTLKPTEKEERMKVSVYVEDDVAKYYLLRILREKEITDKINIICDYKFSQKGGSYTSLASLANNFSAILYETRVIIVFDSDVDLSVIKHYKYVKKLPSLNENDFPLEKELVLYILSLSGDNKFFKDIGKQKEAFKQEFSEHNIPIDIEKATNTRGIRIFKNWFDSNKSESKKYITRMVRDNNDYYITFKLEFIKMVNEILLKHNLVPVKNTGQK